jgi:hypothetical protein
MIKKCQARSTAALLFYIRKKQSPQIDSEALKFFSKGFVWEIFTFFGPLPADPALMSTGAGGEGYENETKMNLI